MARDGVGPVPLKAPLKAAHVNMMTDSIIVNMPPEGLRSIMRSLLGLDPSITSKFHSLSADYLARTAPASTPALFTLFTPYHPTRPTAALSQLQSRYRCLMGCGFGFACVESLCEVVTQVQQLDWESDFAATLILDELAVVDADVVQAVTAIQKELLTEIGSRSMTAQELEIVTRLHHLLLDCRAKAKEGGREFAFERGLARLEKLDGITSLAGEIPSAPINLQDKSLNSSSINVEVFSLGKSQVPRMFMGLWQFSSPAWGTAPRSKINAHFRKHVDAGFTAYDMADHYGDAEVTFGQFRSSQADADRIFCATKYCVFNPITLTKEVVEANVTERLQNINADHIDLLQLHWQQYDDQQYIKMARLAKEDPRVSHVGLCNFDTQRMNEIIESGVDIVSNQVQFSLIDLRPTFRMAESCRKHDVKLLTYGSLCGGFLADKWLNQPAPNLFDEDMTPSHRKYYEMITIWGGWALFQELLATLSTIGQRYKASISNVASRWVLDHDYVGAVIIGARMGISEHTEENRQVFSFRLDQEDQSSISSILERSNSTAVFKAMGDCGAEYR